MSNYSGWTACPPRAWIRLFNGFSPWGFVYLWTETPPSKVGYKIYSSSPPFYLEESMTLAAGPNFIFLGPSPYVELWVGVDGFDTLVLRTT
jgi:hypothetical protein